MLKKQIEQEQHREFNKKVAIIGSGYVGAGIAYSMMIKDIAREIVLIDTKENVANAEMLDIRHGITNMGSANIYCGDYSDIKDSDLIIITAGRNRKPEETRLDLAKDNIEISNKVINEIKKYYNQGVILIVANPVDILTYHYSKQLNLPAGRIFGTGCILDSSRFINILSDYIKLSPEFINAMIIGEHGNSQIPLWSEIKVANISLEEFCRVENIEINESIKNKIEEKVVNMGTEIIRGKGKTYYGISTCVCHIADAILNRRIITASVSSVLNGEYGFNGVAISVPSLIDYNGIKSILPLDISRTEHERLIESVKTLKDKIKNLYKTLN